MSDLGWSAIGFLAGFAVYRSATVLVLRRIGTQSAACGPAVRLPRDWANLLQKRPRALRTLRLSGVVFASVDDLVDSLADAASDASAPDEFRRVVFEVAVAIGTIATDVDDWMPTIEMEDGQ